MSSPGRPTTGDVFRVAGRLFEVKRASFLDGEVRSLTLDVVGPDHPPFPPPLPGDPSPEVEAWLEVRGELARQLATWGEQNHDPFAYLSILTEEVGEAAQAANELRFGQRGSVEELRAELVQVAAVAVAFLACLSRGTWRWGRPGVDLHEGEPDDSRPPEERLAVELERCLRELMAEGRSSTPFPQRVRIESLLGAIDQARAKPELPF